MIEIQFPDSNPRKMCIYLSSPLIIVTFIFLLYSINKSHNKIFNRPFMPTIYGRNRNPALSMIWSCVSTIMIYASQVSYDFTYQHQVLIRSWWTKHFISGDLPRRLPNWPIITSNDYDQIRFHSSTSSLSDLRDDIFQLTYMAKRAVDSWNQFSIFITHILPIPNPHSIKVAVPQS